VSAPLGFGRMASPRSPDDLAAITQRRDHWRSVNVPGSTEIWVPHTIMVEWRGSGAESLNSSSPKGGAQIRGDEFGLLCSGEAAMPPPVCDKGQGIPSVAGAMEAGDWLTIQQSAFREWKRRLTLAPGALYVPDLDHSSYRPSTKGGKQRLNE
jgi:hypothetical protein